MSNNIITGLDIGSSNIKGVVGVVQKNNKMRVIKTFSVPSAGMRKGMIVDMEEAASALKVAVEEIRSVSRTALKRVYVNLGSSRVEAKISRGFVVVSRGDDVISRDDRQRAIEASRTINLPSNREVVHALPREYIVDNVGDIQDPVGLSGTRLEVESFLVHAFSPVMNNLYRCAEMAGFKIFGLIFGPLAVARAVLSKNQLELGVASLDIGASTTSLSVFEEGQLLHTRVFPVGSANVTNDVAIGLKIPLEIAENIKLSYGAAMSTEVSRRDSIELAKISPDLDGEVSRKFVAEIVEIRMAEIMELVSDELKEIERYAKLPGGVVLTGGGVKMPGVVDLAKQELRLPAQIGTPVPSLLDAASSDVKEYIDDPGMALAFGLFLWGGEEADSKRSSGGITESGKGILRFFKQFLP